MSWKPITRDQALSKYGPLVHGSWQNILTECTMFIVPQDIAVGWINSATGKPTTHIYVNKDMVDPLLEALGNVRGAGLLGELKTFDGCWMARDVRGVIGLLSWHFWAMAIDINAKENQLGAVPMLSSAMVACFKSAGFIWGGDFKRLDGMHLQLGLD